MIGFDKSGWKRGVGNTMQELRRVVSSKVVETQCCSCIGRDERRGRRVVGAAMWVSFARRRPT
jgi:hypothetical protein